MAEAGRPWMAWAWLALGLAFSATLLLAHPAAVVGAWLAQPALALGLSRLRGLRPVLPAPVLQRELLEVIRKYINVDADAVKVDLHKDGDSELLDISVALPEKPATAANG